MQVFAREPVASGEGCNLAPDLAFLALQTFDFGFVRGELLQIGFDKRGDGRIAFSCGDPGTPVSLVVNCNCDIAHIFTVSQRPLQRLPAGSTRVRDIEDMEAFSFLVGLYEMGTLRFEELDTWLRKHAVLANPLN